jgi:RHS repeat-associated protein
MTNERLVFGSRTIGTALLFIALCTLAPGKARAQSSGPNVDECASAEVDSNADVELTVCLEGNESGLTAYTGVLNENGEMTVPLVGASESLSFDGTSVYNSPEYQDSLGGYTVSASYTLTPQLNSSYTLTGTSYECYDPTGTNSPNCSWTAISPSSLSVQVTVAPAVNLAQSNVTTPSGTAVTFTASISPYLTGAITFFDGTTSIGMGMISNGAATLTTTELSVGYHTITAYWPGNSGNPALTSTAVYHNVFQPGQIQVPAAGIIGTLAGNGISSYAGDNGYAMLSEIDAPRGVAVDAAGNIYIADYSNQRIRKVTASTGMITTVAGNGTRGYSGDSGSAASAELNDPAGVAVDSSGNIYIADYGNQRIRKVTASTGIISTVAGNGTGGYSGDGGAATSAKLYDPAGVAVDGSGNIYIADYLNQRIRKVTASTGIISTVAGNGTRGYTGDGATATGAEVNYPYGVAVDSSGDIYIADLENNAVRAVYQGGSVLSVQIQAEHSGVSPVAGDIYTVAGSGTGCTGQTDSVGDGCPATSAELSSPEGVAVDASGNIYIADFGNQRVRWVTPAICFTINGHIVSCTGASISSVAGNGIYGYSGDGGPAANAELHSPGGVAVDASGNIYIADSSNERVREVGSLGATQSGLSVTSSGTPSTLGTAVTFTATISGGRTGTITFYDGDTAIGTGTISGTAATFATSSLAAGDHSITASWQGNSSYDSATSAAFIQAVSGSTWDAGTVTLNVCNPSNDNACNSSNSVFSKIASYGLGSTPSSVAESLAGSNANVSITAVNDTLYIQALGSGGANTDYYYALTSSWNGAFTNPSFQGSPASGDLGGGASGSSTSTPVYCFGPPGSSFSSASCTPSSNSMYDAVGNVVGFDDTVMGTWAYGYDTLNRLTSGQNTATTSTSSQYAGYYFCWAYDAFGNRIAQQIQTSPCPSSESSLQPTASYNANNQVTWTTVNSAADGFSYDQAGDVTNDNVNQYLYDAEGRICAVASTPVAGFTTMTGYVYDAEGNRVAKGTITTVQSLVSPSNPYGMSCDPSVNGLTTASNETDYVLGPDGQQVTELAQDANGTMNWQRTYVYAGSALIGTYDPNPTSSGAPVLSFRLTDSLGTMRVTTDASGVAQSACVGLPFGDGQGCTGNMPDPRYFTGKERDAESGNDYFGARYYASTMGRWLSPDLPFADQDTENPQSWNLYNYVRNNPLNSIDDSGMLTIIIGGTWYNPHDWNYSHSPLTSEAQSYFHDPAVGFLYWSGGLSDTDRIAGAEQLRKMINGYNFAPGEQLNIIAHSHGGNVALLASQMQLDHPIDNLITLGTPGLAMYTPNADSPADWRNIGAWYNIQASTDRVPNLDEDTSQFNRPGAHNFVVPTPGLGRYGGNNSAHSSLWDNSNIRSQWWNWWLNQQQQSTLCARTGASDSLGNSTGMSGCQ